MKRNNQSSRGGGICFLEALFLVFLGLKLAGIIDWSWWLVTAPIWMPIVFVLAICAGIFVVEIIKDKLSERRIARRKAATSSNDDNK